MKLNRKALEMLPALLERYKYPLLILLLGAALVLWPSKGGKAEAAPVTEPEESVPEDIGARYRAETEAQLEQLLSQIDGAGRVRVMLTLKTGPAANYQTDRDSSEDRDGERVQSALEEKTVMVSRGSAYNEPAVISTAYPVFQGALVVAEGGADPRIRYQLSAAVAALLGLGADQITVVKMK